MASFSELPNKTRQQFIQLVLNNVTSLELANAIKSHILLQFFQTSSFIQELDQLKITQLNIYAYPLSFIHIYILIMNRLFLVFKKFSPPN